MNTVIETSNIVTPRCETTTTRRALNGLILAALSVCALAVWIAAAAEQAPEQPRIAPVAVPAPYDSPYPAPRIDPSAPLQEPAPTF